MKMPFLYGVILYCLHKINGERTIYSVYHLLNGKKSSQTIQDAHLFQLGPFFKSYPSLTRVQLEQIVTFLYSQGLLLQETDQLYQVTEQGIVRINKWKSEHLFLQYLDGINCQVTDGFWERLTLLVQVASKLANHESEYIPIQKSKEVQRWLKGFLNRANYNRGELAETLFAELVSCLQENEYIDPSVVVIRLTGCHSIGLTEAQACEALQVEPTLFHFHFVALLHFMMKTIKSKKGSYPLLYPLLATLQKGDTITLSAQKTYTLLKKGFSIDEIAAMRKLKSSTIHDHIVELALNIESFDISPFVNGHKQKLILDAAQKTSSRQLKYIRQSVQEADYFEIRLVLARLGAKR
jgi:uncharacterized protein YpbB